MTILRRFVPLFCSFKMAQAGFNNLELKNAVRECGLISMQHESFWLPGAGCSKPGLRLPLVKRCQNLWVCVVFNAG